MDKADWIALAVIVVMVALFVWLTQWKVSVCMNEGFSHDYCLAFALR